MESDKIKQETEDTPIEDVAKTLKRLSSSSPGSSSVICLEGEKFWVQNVACPEYMKSGSNKDGPILLIQKFSALLMAQGNIDRIKSDTLEENTFNSSTPPGMKYKKESDDLDVTGSPLKCPFAFDVREFDMSPFTVALPCSKKKQKSISYIPYSPVAARRILSHVYKDLKNANDDTDCLPVWIACDGSDKQKTLFIGTRYKKLDATQGIVVSSGPHKGKEELPSLNDLKMQLTFGSTNKRVNSSATAEYTKSGNAEVSCSSSITISCSWKEPLYLLSLPALDSSVTVTAHIVPEDSSSVMHQMYEEVTFLKGLANGLSTGEVVWLISDDERTIQEQLEDVFEVIREKGSQEKVEDTYDDEGGLDSILKERFFKSRQITDFTDRLWTILMKCRSYHALVDALTYVFEAVLTGKIRPQIHLQSRTQVGRLARSLMQGQESSFPDLSDLKPVEMLIEMGIEKVKRDCVSIFQDCGLATGEQLSWFVENDNSYAETMMRIDRLHVALHAVIAVQSFLDLAPAPLIQFTVQALNDVRKCEIGYSYTFVFPLQISFVRELLNSWNPVMWEVTMHHTQGTAVLVKKCRITTQPSVDYSKNDDTIAEELKEEDEEKHYFCTSTTHVTDSLFT